MVPTVKWISCTWISSQVLYHWTTALLIWGQYDDYLHPLSDSNTVYSPSKPHNTCCASYQTWSSPVKIRIIKSQMLYWLRESFIYLMQKLTIYKPFPKVFQQYKCYTIKHHSYISHYFHNKGKTVTVKSEIFARHLFSRMALKDIFMMLKCVTRSWFTYISKGQSDFAISWWFYFHKTSWK